MFNLSAHRDESKHTLIISCWLIILSVLLPRPLPFPIFPSLISYLICVTYSATRICIIAKLQFFNFGSHIVSYQVTSRHTISYHILSYHVIPWHITSRNITINHAIYSDCILWLVISLSTLQYIYPIICINLLYIPMFAEICLHKSNKFTWHLALLFEHIPSPVPMESQCYAVMWCDVMWCTILYCALPRCISRCHVDARMSVQKWCLYDCAYCSIPHSRI